MKQIIEELIVKKKKRYKENYEEMLGDYNRELEIINGYEGRQILELLQNCDDEGAKDVFIDLDVQNKIISISNDGTSFSEKGYRSLFIANLSSKTSKRKYIGNKGLGFRSIINWSDQIEIISNDISLKYSEQNLLDVYKTLFSEQERKKIAEEEGLRDNIVPMAMLSMPKISDKKIKTEYSTTINISFKESSEDSIVSQLNDLTSDILLFLKSIETIKIRRIEGEKTITCLREDLKIDSNHINKCSRLILNDRIWTVYTFEEELPEKFADQHKKEKELYQISIAIEEKMSHSSPYLYSFFPTNIRIEQPYVLHATFDLDSTRNQIIESEKNKFILCKIVYFTVEVAKYISKEVISYDPLKIIFHKHKADTLSKFDYYDLLDTAIKEQPLFPCVDDTYKTLDESLFISNEMAQLLIDIKGESELGYHLIPTYDQMIVSLLHTVGIDDKFTALSDYDNIINSLSSLKIDNNNRAKLIKIVTENLKGFQVRKLKLLTDKEGNLINSQIDIYTPATNNESLRIPGFAHIQFMNRELYEAIFQFYKKEEYEKRGKSRFVYDLLYNYCNIHSYEPITLAEKIIRTTNEELDKVNSNEHKIEIVQEMNRCLYENYKSETERSKLAINSVPSITKDKSIKSINKLHLSKGYPKGKNIELLFDGIYTPSDYVASSNLLGFSANEPIENIEAFLIWLGVNLYFTFLQKSDEKSFVYGNSLSSHPFLSFTKNFRNNHNNYTSYKVAYLDIEKKETILQHLDIHKMIVLGSIDNVLRKQLNNYDKEDLIKLFFRYENTITGTPSYLKFIITSYYKTDGFLLDEKFSWINDFEIDYHHELFEKFNLNKIRIKEVLLNLGAVDSINQLTIEKLTASFEKFNQRFADGAGSHQFYKKALSHYDLHKLKLTKKVELFAKVDGKLKLTKQNEIYFSDNNFLPSGLTTTYRILNFPLRAGAKKAIEFFEINDLNTLNVTLLKSIDNTFIQREFECFFESIKPYLLAYRLEDIEKSEVKDDQVLRLKNLKFKFCTDLFCKIQENEFSLDEYNYIYDVSQKTYYLKVNFDDDLEKLQQNPLFIDNFSEILLNTFATNSEKAQFESLLRDSKTTIDYNIQKQLGDNVLDEAKMLLGLVNSKNVFWHIILDLVNRTAPNNDEELDNLIEATTKGLDIYIYYDDITSQKNMDSLEKLFKKLNITVSDFNKISSTKLSTYKLNLKKLNNHLSGQESMIKQNIWNHLQKNKELRKLLLEYFNSIELLKNKYESLRPIIDANFQVDHAAINMKLIREQFYFIEFNDLESLSYNKLYRRNRMKFSEEQIVEIENYPEIHSLLYFDDLTPVIKFLEKNNATKPAVIPSNENNRNVSGVNVTYISNVKTRVKINGSHKSSVYTPSNSENERKISGNKVEDIAYNTLVELYSENYVIHKSKETEWEHYDIKYSTDEGKNWIYVDVKSATGGKFTMSVWEKEFGEAHYDNYEVWAFKDNEFIVLSDFFASNPILNPIEFEVILD